MSNTPEPFGYFKAEPFGWTDCAETDECAKPLYEQADIDLLVKQRDELLAVAIHAAEQIRRCDYTPARSTLLVAIAKAKGGAA